MQSERQINLRLLRHRYGEDMNDVFKTTVTKGRPAKGMPTWEGVFTEQDFAKIYAFLETVQDPYADRTAWNVLAGAFRV